MDHVVNRPVILPGKEWKWAKLGNPVQVPMPEGTWRDEIDREEQTWWVAMMGNAGALVAFYRGDLKQRAKAYEVLSFARSELVRSYGPLVGRKLQEAAQQAVDHYVVGPDYERDRLGTETILWAQLYLCAIVIQEAYHTCEVKGQGRRWVDRIAELCRRGISAAFPDDLAQELLDMKAVRKARGAA